VVGLAAGTTHVNSRVAASERLGNESFTNTVPIQSAEYATEVFYGWSPVAGLVLRPNIQYVVHPGGSDAYKNVLVVGLKSTATF
jgi:porin